MKEGVALSKASSSDVFLYNGEISREHDHKFTRLVQVKKRNAKAVLFLVTNGGDPDAGYKMSRCLQTHYDSHTVVVSGMCKSAGTLIAMGRMS